ncbi:MAG: hypothetical protein WAL63_20330, partial [Solirubrobacteraceae bacterium]
RIVKSVVWVSALDLRGAGPAAAQRLSEGSADRPVLARCECGLLLERGELSSGYWFREVDGGCGGGEADDRAVDVDSDEAVGDGLVGGGVDAGQQIGAGGREIEDMDLNADGKSLVMITGANQGGKSTFCAASGSRS